MILFLCLFLLFDDALDECFSEGGGELVETGFRIDWEAVLELKELLSGVVVGLCEGDVGDGVDYLDVVEGGFKWD